MTRYSQVITDVNQIIDLAVVKRDTVALDTGQVRLQLEMFAMTANNVTYAATGHQIGYWKFFPVPEKDRGVVPVWGFARVIESRSDALKDGARVYGFFPFAEQVVVTPEALGKTGVLDVAAHRHGLPAVYNTYVRVEDAGDTEEAYRALLQPLIATSYLLFDWLEDNGCFGAEQIVVGSASSKTGLGLCAFLAQAKGRQVKVVGLTSKGNKAFVQSLGFCDAVVGYDDIEAVAKVPSVYVDMAGNAAVKRALHAHLGDALKHSSAVGISHWDKFAAPLDLAGPKPQFFFAPAQIAKRQEEWGPGVIERKIGEATTQIATDAARWLTLERHAGLEAGVTAYLELAEGRSDPSVGHVVQV